MSQVVLFISLLWVHCATKSLPEVQCNCNDDALIPCPDLSDQKGDFTAVAWYKINNIKVGIIRKDKGDERSVSYDFHRKAEFGENYSLLLPRVTPEDAGMYECAISANVGGQNKDVKVKLSVHECLTQAKPSPVSLVNTTQTKELSRGQIQEMSVMWTFITYAAVAVIKILLSLICIKVICCISERRRTTCCT